MQLVNGVHTFLYKAQELQVAGNIGVNEGTILLIITQDSSGLKKLHVPRFCKFHAKIASFTIVKSCVTVGHFCGWQIFYFVHSL